jgi:hypothetical protein
MPEFNVREVRLPELHLPEIKRDEIVRSLSGVHLPAAALAKARPSVARMPAVGVTAADLGRLLAAGAALARFARPAPARRSWLRGRSGLRTRLPEIRIVRPGARRSRRPMLVVALLVAAVAGLLLMLLRRPDVRVRVDSAARGARQKVAELRRRTVPEADAIGEPVEAGSSAVGVDGSLADEEPSAVI